MREVCTLSELDRRPIATRDAPWANRLASRLVQLGLTPNCISVLSALFATLGGFALWWSSKLSPFGACLLYLLAAVCIQLRLVCNLLDGMVAIEGGKTTPSGTIFNELPDRISDTVLFLGAGYGVGGAWGATLGFGASLFAMSTAYVRLLGASAGVPHDFSGPMAKQHRMALLTVAALAAAVSCHFERARAPLACALGIVTVGSLWTAVRRAARVVEKLRGAT
ncbi:MAG: hypothetical protein RLZZ450_5087 [Pseudomonadota bacterium]|jgi:phosphatidylglycerophosphate synthase